MSYSHDFVEEYDERRGTDFTQTFPELKDFYAKYSKK